MSLIVSSKKKETLYHNHHNVLHVLQDPTHLIAVGRNITNSSLSYYLSSPLSPEKKKSSRKNVEVNVEVSIINPSSYLIQLTVIILSKNQLTSFPEELRYAHCITKLDLSNNKIGVVSPVISDLTSLKRLNLSYNKITFLPDEFCDLISLEKLKISHNCLLKLPIPFYQLTSLTNLKISSNPIICPPLFVVSKGISETFTWLRGMEAVIEDPTTHNELFMFSRRETFQLPNPSSKPWNRSITVTSDDSLFSDSNQNMFFTLEHGLKTGQGRRKYMEDMHSIQRELKISRKPQNSSKKKTSHETDHEVVQDPQYLIQFSMEGFNEQGKELGEVGELDSGDFFDAQPDLVLTSSSTSLSISSQEIFPSVSFFAIYDGHSGIRAAAYSQEYLQKNIFSTQAFLDGDYVSALIEGFEITDRQWLQIAIENDYEDGTTATVVLIVNNEVYVANVGDSTAILSREFRPYVLSLDHKPSLKEEVKRIKEAGGWIGKRKNGQTLRVMGDLAMTRSIGDKRLKIPNKLVIATPSVTHLVLKPTDQFIIIGSDGIWDGITHQNAISVVSEYLRAQDAAENLFEIAARSSGDNLTCIVIFIRWDVTNAFLNIRPRGEGNIFDSGDFHRGNKFPNLSNFSSENEKTLEQQNEINQDHFEGISNSINPSDLYDNFQE